MRMRETRGRTLAATSAALLFVGTMTVFGDGAGQVILDEDFADGIAKPESNLVIVSSGTTSIVEPVAGSDDWVLQLTSDQNDQFGGAWFDVPFDLREKKVVFEVDTFIWGGSSPPADGMAAAFQLFDGLTPAERTSVSGDRGGQWGSRTWGPAAMRSPATKGRHRRGGM